MKILESSPVVVLDSLEITKVNRHIEKSNRINEEDDELRKYLKLKLNTYGFHYTARKLSRDGKDHISTTGAVETLISRLEGDIELLTSVLKAPLEKITKLSDGSASEDNPCKGKASCQKESEACSESIEKSGARGCCPRASRKVCNEDCACVRFD